MDVSNIQLTERQQELFDKLTKLQKAFVTFYVQGNNATDAHRLAGGKSNTQEGRRALASQILSNPNVKAFVDDFQQTAIEEAKAKAIMSRQEMLERLSTMARANVHDVGTVHSVEVEGADGKVHTQHFITMKGMEEMTEAGRIALSGFTVTKSGLLIPQMHDPKAAMKQIADLLGYNREADDETGKLTQEERLLNAVQDHAVTDERLDQ